MTDPSSTDWPDRSYHIGQRDHLHALGVITASFNELESALAALFFTYLKLEEPASHKIFALLNNYQRIDLLRDGVAAFENDPTVKELVLHFIVGFETLANSRNFLTHSHTILKSPDHLTFGKSSKRQPDVWTFAHMGIQNLRQVADDIHAFGIFGQALKTWVWARDFDGEIMSFPNRTFHKPPWPEKPPLPAELKSVPLGALESPKNPPQSSEG
jgi:hypothetical protein